MDNQPASSVTRDMAARVRSHDWGQTRLGPIERWPTSLRLMVDVILASGFPMALRWGPDFVLIYNDGYKTILGDKHPWALGLTFREVWPEVQSRLAPLHEEILAGKSPGQFSIDLPLNIRRHAGQWEEARFTVSYSPVPDPYAPSGVGGVLITAVETSERVRAETALLEAEKALRHANSELRKERELVMNANRRLRAETEELHRLFEQAPGFMAVLDGPEHVFSLANKSYLKLIGNREVLGKTVVEALPEIEGQGFLQLLDQVYASGQPYVGRGARVLLQQAPGTPAEERLLDFIYQPVTADDGTVTGIFVQGHDLTELMRAEEALKESEARFRLVAETAPVMLWMGDVEGKCVYLNAALRDFWGVESERVSSFDWNTTLHPDDRQKLFEPFERGMRNQTGFSTEARFRRRDGSMRLVHTDARPRFGAAGEFLGMIGVNVDITDSRRVEDALRDLNAALEQEARERSEQLRVQEEELRQAQKMEAVGQLTGGIAHDFNNLLQVVVGNLEILQRNLAPTEGRLRRATEHAMIGAQRAATLTQRLLAFSRRQPLVPKLIKVNDLVTEMSELLYRSLGETIAVETVLAAGLWQTEADPNQLESALLNLAVNARDAMPEGGKLTIETANAHIDEGYAARQAEVSPGQYVLICVSDTGTGMDKATIERAFEPFFTTKEPGKGTGLGLSQVYGFVKQSGGHVKVYSEPGQGTTVKIYLPRLHAEELRAEALPHSAIPEGSRSETVLVVEDDDDVRAYSVEILRELGYRVLEAHDGPSALRLLEQQSQVALLFCDVVLPGGWTGAQTAEQARALRPGLKVLFTTGYARNAIVHHGRLDPGVHLVTKPFTFAELAAKVRDVLDAPPG
jgi:PAS domain S-box-containing protein